MTPDTPIPNDLPLPLPAPEWILVAVLVGIFLLHILFVSMMVGGSFLTLVYEWKGRKDPKWEAVAHDLAASITVNKSIAVVLGVGPLLAINTLYTTYFYSANALTGDFWVLIIPLVAGAFLLTYAHKYLWDRMPKGLHIALIAVVVAIFAFLPLIFLANVNLMLYPHLWPEVGGFWEALMLPNVWPRYAHFLLSCPAMMGLFMVWSYRRRSAEDLAAKGLKRGPMIRLGYHWVLWPTLAQFFVGPIALVSLPEVPGPTGQVTMVFLGSLLMSVLMCLMLWGEIRRPDAAIGSGFAFVWGPMLIIMLMMGAGRHMYREAAVDEHRAAVAAKTQEFQARSAAARARVAAAGDASQ